MKRKDQLLKWITRELENCEQDIRSYLRILNSTSPMQNDLTCLDLDSIITLQVGYRQSHNGIIRIDEAALEDYICSLNHVQRMVFKEDVVFAPSLSRVVHCKVDNSKGVSVASKISRYFGKVCQLWRKRETSHSFATTPRRERKFTLKA